MNSTERFLAYLHNGRADVWTIAPQQVSEMWNYVLGDDWYYGFEIRYELAPLFDSIFPLLAEALPTLTDILQVELEVEYEIGKVGKVKPTWTRFGTWVGTGPMIAYRVNRTMADKIDHQVEATIVKMKVVPVSERI